MSALYKILVDAKSCHGGNLKWSLPNGKPGKWHSVKDETITICENGLHLTLKPHLWFKWGCEMYEAEGKEWIAEKDDKVVFRSARLLKRVEHPKWWQNALKFVNDEIPKTPFLVPDGQPLAKWKLFTGDSWAAARSAARSAARAAAWDAAGDAAGDAAWDAARSAARAAAGDAAWDAAWDAARAAARSAAWAAAGDAAWAAALKAQYHVTSDLGFPDKAKHLKHVKARWEVWRKGYAVSCDVNGVLYVYAKP